jgi:hypothetical protein
VLDRFHSPIRGFFDSTFFENAGYAFT